MDRARQRLEGFRRDPVRHALHAGKVLLKFKLLEVQKQPRAEFLAWAGATPYLQTVQARFFPDTPLAAWMEALLDDLARVGAAEQTPDWVFNR